MRALSRGVHWYRIFFSVCLWTTTEGRGAQDTSISRASIPVDPAAVRAFPNAQLSAACGIISIEGLGKLDGDYGLVDVLPASKGSKYSWVGVSANTQDLVLSWQTAEHAWMIRTHGRRECHAFVLAGSDVPPWKSSRWHIFSEESSTFEGVRHAVSIFCPACAAVAVSKLPGTLAACDGPYRPLAGSKEEGIFSWSHVSNERCTLLHDEAGNSLVTLENQHVTARQDFAAADEVLPSRQQWLQMVEETGAPSSERDGAKVVCTSAGRTTRLVFGLVESPSNLAQPEASTQGNDVDSTTPPSKRFKFTSSQDGSIVSSAHNNFHIRLSGAERSKQRSGEARGVLDSTLVDVGASLRESRVRITVSGVEALTTSLERLGTMGVLLTLRYLEGTHAVEVCILGHRVKGAKESQQEEGPEICLAETVLMFEVFSAETQVVQRRSLSKTMLSSSTMTGELDLDTIGADVTRVLFLIDLKVVDGYKLSTLHLMKHLPDNFQASTLDLSCASGVLPVKEIFEEEHFDVFRLCTLLEKETYDSALRESGSVPAFLYSALINATTWEGVISDSPDVARALGDLYRYLSGFDAFVMSNGGRDADAYLLEVARLAGVATRMVNLGAITGGYMSPLFSAATSLVGPSHYVAHNPVVNRNAGGLPVNVCLPVMDAARVLAAAHSCQSVPRPPRFEANRTTDALGFSGGSTSDRAGDFPPATFIMVGQLETYKTPGMFVRAIAVLNRRWREGGERGRKVEGVLVGKGFLRGHMENLALHLNASVRFAGFLPNDVVPCEVQKATALVLPSISLETFGMVGPEAMLLGVPVVTFGFGGTGELVRHMENGILVADPTPKALANALHLLSEDTDLRHRLGTQARLDALGALSMQEMVDCHTNELA